MLRVTDLLDCIDAWKAASGQPELPDSTISERLFRASGKIALMRGGAGITLDRFNTGMTWLAANWPTGEAVPKALAPYLPHTSEDAA